MTYYPRRAEAQMEGVFGDRTHDEGRVAPATGIRKQVRRLKRLTTDR
jgi:hypothetical protein